MSGLKRIETQVVKPVVEEVIVVDNDRDACDMVNGYFNTGYNTYEETYNTRGDGHRSWLCFVAGVRVLADKAARGMGSRVINQTPRVFKLAELESVPFVTGLQANLSAREDEIVRLREQIDKLNKALGDVAPPEPQPTWTTSKGETLFIKDMNSGHLANTLRLLERSGMGARGVAKSIKVELAARATKERAGKTVCRYGYSDCREPSCQRPA